VYTSRATSTVLTAARQLKLSQDLNDSVSSTLSNIQVAGLVLVYTTLGLSFIVAVALAGRRGSCARGREIHGLCCLMASGLVINILLWLPL